MFDVLIRDGRIVDGSGNSWRRGDLAIQGARIAAVGRIEDGAQARQVIDARDMVVCPGFIDAHVHADLMLFEEPDFPVGVYQGVA